MIRYASEKGLRTVLYTNGILLNETMMNRLNRSGLDILTVSVEPDDENSLRHRGVSLHTIHERIKTAVQHKSGSMDIKLSVVVHPDNVNKAGAIQHQFNDLVRHAKMSPLIRYNGTQTNGNCIEPWRGSLSILTSGDVTPCCVSAGYRPIRVGNVTQNTLSEIIKGYEFKECLTSFINGKQPEVCRRCNVFNDKKIPKRIPSLTRFG
jgi:radical SAM protein with 4Fe4S-binding SPASM domain